MIRRTVSMFHGHVPRQEPRSSDSCGLPLKKIVYKARHVWLGAATAARRPPSSLDSNYAPTWPSPESRSAVFNPVASRLTPSFRLLPFTSGPASRGRPSIQFNPSWPAARVSTRRHSPVVKAQHGVKSQGRNLAGSLNFKSLKLLHESLAMCCLCSSSSKFAELVLLKSSLVYSCQGSACG